MASKTKVSEPLYRGATYTWSYQHENLNGTHLPLEGPVFFTVKKQEYDDDTSDATAPIKATVALSDHVNAADGYTEWKITVPRTNIDPGDYNWDIVVEEADGTCGPPVAIGTLKISGKVTNRTE